MNDPHIQQRRHPNYDIIIIRAKDQGNIKRAPMASILVHINGR